MGDIFGYRDTNDLTSDLTGITLFDYTERQALADVQRFATDFSALVSNMISDFADVGDIAKMIFGDPAGGEMQPYGEAGATEASLPAEGWDVAFPIRRFRSRKLYTEEYLQTTVLELVEKDIIQAAGEYWNTAQKQMLRALLGNANYDWTDGPFPGSNLGTIHVKRLLNNDSDPGSILVNGANVTIGDKQNYFGSNEVSMTIAPFVTAYQKLRALGNSTDVVVRCSQADGDIIKGYSQFIKPLPNFMIDPLGKYARVSSPEVSSAKSIGRLFDTNIDAEVVIQPLMPAGYVVMYDRAAPKPLRMRQHKLAQFQGFRLVQDETRTAYGEQSLRNKRWEWIGGFGVRNRTNGVVFQAVNSAAYTPPTI